MGGMFGGGPLSGGRVIGGFGAIDVPGMGYMNVMDLDNMSDEGHVEEISMDDFMDTLIEALDTDADVFESDRQITSDPWFGKQRFSLGPNGIKLANPMSIFNDIYGNPGFGMPSMMGPFGPMGSMGQPGIMGGQFGAMGGMNPMMAPMIVSMPQNGMMEAYHLLPRWEIRDLLAQWAWLGKATTILARLGSKAASIWVQLRLHPPLPSPCMGLILKATGIPFKATVNLATDLGLLNLAIPHRKTPLLRSSLQGNPYPPHNIQSTPNILVSLNNLFTSNLSSNLDLSRTTTNNLATISLHKPLTTSTL